MGFYSSMTPPQFLLALLRPSRPLQLDTKESHTVPNAYKICLFHSSGDWPACQLEAGQQKGGHFYSWRSEMKANRGHDLAYMFGCKRLTLQERIDKLIKTR